MKFAKNYVLTLTKSVLVTLMITSFASCQKNKSEDEPPPVVISISPKGYWTGSYTTTGVLGQDKYAVLIKDGGIARVYELGTSTDTLSLSPLAKVNATWVLTGTTLETTYLSGANVITTSTTVNMQNKTMIGTWSKGGVVKGTISLAK